MKIILIAVFLTGALLAASADILGFGDGIAFGRLQIAGVMGGIILSLLVPWFRWHQRRQPAGPAAADMSVDRRETSDRRDAGGNGNKA